MAVSISIAFMPMEPSPCTTITLLIRAGDFGADTERQADAHRTERTGIQTMTRRERRDRSGRPKFSVSWPSTQMIAFAFGEIADPLPACGPVMDVAISAGPVGTRAAVRFCCSPSWLLLPRHALKLARRGPCFDPLKQLPEHRLAVADDRNVDVNELPVAISAESTSIRAIVAFGPNRGGEPWPMM